jgi:BirA family biotin operon repressor/biotin-[acetyl-CoA-carboxylase] ligase
VLGIGLNVNLSQDEFPEELRATAGSVRDVLGREVDRNGLLAAILVHLDALWTGMERDGGRDLVGLARQYCDTLGHLVELKLGMGTIEGIAEDLDEAGRLILRLESGARRLLEIGEIQQTRRMD